MWSRQTRSAGPGEPRAGAPGPGRVHVRRLGRGRVDEPPGPARAAERHVVGARQARVPRRAAAARRRPWADSRQGWNGTVTFAGTFGPELDASGNPVLDESGQLVIVPVDEHRPLPPDALPRVARAPARRDPRSSAAGRASCASPAAIRTPRCASGTSASSSRTTGRPRPDLASRPRPALRGADELGHRLRPRATRVGRTGRRATRDAGTPKTVHARRRRRLLRPRRRLARARGAALRRQRAAAVPRHRPRDPRPRHVRAGRQRRRRCRRSTSSPRARSPVVRRLAADLRAPRLAPRLAQRRPRAARQLHRERAWMHSSTWRSLRSRV